jgi:O-antigen/teichoic acid export membrane protein
VAVESRKSDDPLVRSSRSLTLVQRAFRPSSENLGRRVVDGAAFTFMGIAIRTAITVGSMAILARLLTPADFGHIAMATVVTELAALFANFGFGYILIQRSKIARIQIDTMFWAALSLGVLLTSVVFGLSFVAGYFFDDKMVGALLHVLCLTFILEELTVVPRSLMARMMMFRADFVVQALMLFFRAGTAVIMAMHGFGVWSLVGGALAGGLFQTLAYTWTVGYRPRFRFSRRYLTSTWRTNGGYFGNGILFYINMNLDVVLVGRLLGATSLGYYQNARSLTDEVRMRMVQPLQRVLFPAFSAVQNEPERFRDGILRSGRLLAILFMPVGFGIAAVADELVPLLYGDQWLAMIPVLQVIAIGSGIGAAASVGSPIFNATDRLGLSFRLYFAATVIAVITTLAGSAWGLMGIAYAKWINAAVALLFFRVSLGLVQLGWKHIWNMIGAPFIIALVMLGTIMLAREPVYSIVTSLAGRLGCLVVLGAAIYSAGALIACRSHVGDVMLVLVKFKK